MTNHHVLKKDDLAPNKIIKFSIDNDEFIQIKINNSRKTFTNKIYDITIIEIKKDDNLDINEFLEIDDDIFKDN